MKRTILILSITLSAPLFAAYDFIIQDGDYFGAKTLTGTQRILVTGGGGDFLTLYEYSQADVFNTTHMVSQGNGGIWEITSAGYSKIAILGGDIHELIMASYATAKISGGNIYQIWSSQSATSIKHIEIVCRDGFTYTPFDSTTGYLTGLWGNGDSFNIRLVNASGTSPTINNIYFTIIPEPASMLLLALGGLLVRRK